MDQTVKLKWFFDNFSVDATVYVFLKNLVAHRVFSYINMHSMYNKKDGPDWVNRFCTCLMHCVLSSGYLDSNLAKKIAWS